MVTEADDSGDEATVDNKVARLIEGYDLGSEYGDRLERLWTAEKEEERESLRTLADRFNRRLLESAMATAGLSAVDGEVQNFYRLLTSDDVSSGNRTEARQRLSQAGIDIDQLETDFVTYQAIRSYLTDYRGAAYEHNNGSDSVETVIETIQRLSSRTRSVARQSIDRLNRTGRISIGEYRLFVEIDVLCEDCDTQQRLLELLRTGGCEC